MNKFENFLENVKMFKPKIGIIGDCMIDNYFRVDANRVSPEFPIPVMLMEEESPEKAVPGGAANVVSQFRHFPVSVKLLGYVDNLAIEVFGAEKWGLGFQHENNVNFYDSLNIEKSYNQNIPTKNRFYQKDFPLCRLDIEKKNYGLSSEDFIEARETVYGEWIGSNLDVAIFSDYGKGVFEADCYGKFIDWQKNIDGNTITIVDPKNGPVEKWRGCTVFKPNAKEAKELSGLEDPKMQCDYFQQKIGCMAVVVTNGGQGVYGKVGGKHFDYRSGDSVKAKSVIGAGDCFAAFLAMALSVGMDIIDAVEIAYEAGAIYVQSSYNKPIKPSDLLMSTEKLTMPPEDRDYKLVFTNGCYDLLHTGHLKVLEQAKSFGDKLVVGVNSDDSIKRIKGDKRPIVSLEDRVKMLAALECVDFVVSFDEKTPYALIKKIMPDVLVKGSDWEDKVVVGSDLVEDVRFVELLEGMSTTELISKANRA